MVTIKDIADRLGIAPSTVSKGLNDANDISPELKKLVLDTSIEMGYVTKKMNPKTIVYFYRKYAVQKSNRFWI